MKNFWKDLGGWGKFALISLTLAGVLYIIAAIGELIMMF